MNQQTREHKEKEALEELEGIVIELLPNTTFKVKLDNEILVIAYASGKIKKNRIKILVNDRVVVEMSHYDLSKGRIIKRIK